MRRRHIVSLRTQLVFKSVVLANILHASPAWWEFENKSTNSDSRHLYVAAFVLIFIFKTIPL